MARAIHRPGRVVASRVPDKADDELPRRKLRSVKPGSGIKITMRMIAPLARGVALKERRVRWSWRVTNEWLREAKPRLAWPRKVVMICRQRMVAWN